MQEYLITHASLFDSIIGVFGDTGLEAVGAVLLLALGFLAKKYIVPILQTELARQTANHLLVIADDVTDYFAEKYPDAHWSVWLDKAIDKIIDVTGVGSETAERVACASINRKKERLAAVRSSKITANS